MKYGCVMLMFLCMFESKKRKYPTLHAQNYFHEKDHYNHIKYHRCCSAHWLWSAVSRDTD